MHSGLRSLLRLLVLLVAPVRAILVHVSAGDSEDDIDMQLLEGEAFHEKQKQFQEAAERLRTASPDEQAEAKRKFKEAVAALGLGVKRARTG